MSMEKFVPPTGNQERKPSNQHLVELPVILAVEKNFKTKIK
jgi:hypothetical protein